MSEALFYGILRSIVMLFRRRAEDALKAFDGLPEPPPVEHVGDLLTPLMWQARKQAWAAAALFLRGQARKAGAPESSPARVLAEDDRSRDSWHSGGVVVS